LWMLGSLGVIFNRIFKHLRVVRIHDVLGARRVYCLIFVVRIRFEVQVAGVLWIADCTKSSFFCVYIL
jgi:hypothetical protein